MSVYIVAVLLAILSQCLVTGTVIVTRDKDSPGIESNRIFPSLYESLLNIFIDTLLKLESRSFRNNRDITPPDKRPDELVTTTVSQPSTTFDVEIFDVRRYYSENIRDHLYILDSIDFNDANYKKEGIAFKAPMTRINDDWKPVRRFHHPSGDHFYTIDEADAQDAIVHGWIEEHLPISEQFYGCRFALPGLVAVKRYLGGHDHFYVLNNSATETPWNLYLNGGYSFEKVAFWAYDISTPNVVAPPSNSILVGVPEPVPVELFDIRRYYNKHTTDHFYSLESLNFNDGIYKKEGIAFKAPMTRINDDWKPVRRFYHPSGDHFYTIDEADAQDAIVHGWIEENLPISEQFYGCRLARPGLVAVNRYLGGHDHFYVLSNSAIETPVYLVRYGYSFEKVAFWAYDTDQVSNTANIVEPSLVSTPAPSNKVAVSIPLNNPVTVELFNVQRYCNKYLGCTIDHLLALNNDGMDITIGPYMVYNLEGKVAFKAPKVKINDDWKLVRRFYCSYGSSFDRLFVIDEADANYAISHDWVEESLSSNEQFYVCRSAQPGLVAVHLYLGGNDHIYVLSNSATETPQYFAAIGYSFVKVAFWAYDISTPNIAVPQSSHSFSAPREEVFLPMDVVRYYNKDAYSHLYALTGKNVPQEYAKDVIAYRASTTRLNDDWKLVRRFRASNGDNFYTIDESDVSYAVSRGWREEVIPANEQFYVCQKPLPGLVAINQYIRGEYYLYASALSTIEPPKKLKKQGYKLQKVAFWAYDVIPTPVKVVEPSHIVNIYDVNRYYNNATFTYLYNLDKPGAKNNTTDSNYVKESAEFRAPSSPLSDDWKLVRRFHHPSGGHYYTIYDSDAINAISNGWIEDNLSLNEQYYGSITPKSRLVALRQYKGVNDYVYMNGRRSTLELVKYNSYTFEKEAFWVFDITRDGLHQPHTGVIVHYSVAEPHNEMTMSDPDKAVQEDMGHRTFHVTSFALTSAMEVYKMVILALLLCVLWFIFL
jgi:Repeat of unknown function (DUF5648)